MGAPPGLRTAFDQAREGQAKPPPSPFTVPTGMKNFLDGISNRSFSITGLASSPTPRSLASAAPRASRSHYPLKQLLLRARRTCQDHRRAQTLQGSSKHRRQHLSRLKGKSRSLAKRKGPRSKRLNLPEFPKPETYRSRKTATREAIRAASDQPDEALKWVLEACD